MQSRIATNEEIFKDAARFDGKLTITHFTNEVMSIRSKTGVKHLNHRRLKIQNINGVPHVQHNGSKEAITALVLILSCGKEMVSCAKLDSPYLNYYTGSKCHMDERYRGGE